MFNEKMGIFSSIYRVFILMCLILVISKVNCTGYGHKQKDHYIGQPDVDTYLKSLSHLTSLTDKVLDDPTLANPEKTVRVRYVDKKLPVFKIEKKEKKGTFYGFYVPHKKGSAGSESEKYEKSKHPDMPSSYYGHPGQGPALKKEEAPLNHNQGSDDQIKFSYAPSKFGQQNPNVEQLTRKQIGGHEAYIFHPIYAKNQKNQESFKNQAQQQKELGEEQVVDQREHATGSQEQPAYPPGYADLLNRYQIRIKKYLSGHQSDPAQRHTQSNRQKKIERVPEDDGNYEEEAGDPEKLPDYGTEVERTAEKYGREQFQLQQQERQSKPQGPEQSVHSSSRYLSIGNKAPAGYDQFQEEPRIVHNLKKKVKKDEYETHLDLSLVKNLLSSVAGKVTQEMSDDAEEDASQDDTSFMYPYKQMNRKPERRYPEYKEEKKNPKEQRLDDRIYHAPPQKMQQSPREQLENYQKYLASQENEYKTDDDDDKDDAMMVKMLQSQRALIQPNYQKQSEQLHNHHQPQDAHHQPQYPERGDEEKQNMKYILPDLNQDYKSNAGSGIAQIPLKAEKMISLNDESLTLRGNIPDKYSGALKSISSSQPSSWPSRAVHPSSPTTSNGYAPPSNRYQSESPHSSLLSSPHPMSQNMYQEPKLVIEEQVEAQAGTQPSIPSPSDTPTIPKPQPKVTIPSFNGMGVRKIETPEYRVIFYPYPVPSEVPESGYDRYLPSERILSDMATFLKKK